MSNYLLRLALALAAVLTLAACSGNNSTPQPAPAPEQKAPSIVIEWNEAMLSAIRNGPPRPTVISRSLFMASAAMYDAWAVYDDNATPVALDAGLSRPVAEHTEANQREAVATAAYTILTELFPQYARNSNAFANLLNQQGYGVNDSLDPALPAGIGNLAAQAIIDQRASDGSNWENNFADFDSDYGLYVPVNSADPTAPNGFLQPEFEVNAWCPLRVPTGKLVGPDGMPMVDHSNPATYADQKFLTPHWGAVTPFALESGDQLRPPPPPVFGSDEPYTDALGNTMTGDEAFKAQFAEVLSYQSEFNDRYGVIAEYWADGPRSETPPGHWNSLAHGIALRDNHGIEEDVKLFLALNGAVFDAGIACWDAKRTYNGCRPAAGVRYLNAGEIVRGWMGPGKGFGLIPGEEWMPFQSLTFVTPPFPEYTSGHSTFSGAAAEVLTRFTGSNRFYDGKTRALRDYNRDGVTDLIGQYIAPAHSLAIDPSVPAAPIVLQWETFQEAADEAGISRLYGGIHIQDGDRRARVMGKEIGGLAFDKAHSLWGD